MKLSKIIYSITMFRSKKYIISKYDTEFWKKFKDISKENLNNIIPSIVDIGDSMFAFNYAFAPAYIAWYKSFEKLKISPNEIDKNIWKMNENLLSLFPKSILRLSGKSYFNALKKDSHKQIKRQNNNLTNPYDWKISYKEIDENNIEIDITECAFKKLAKDFHVEGLLPGVCRMDYLFGNLMEYGFERTKTLGDGDECCNCKFCKVSTCKWSPEEGFIYRK